MGPTVGVVDQAWAETLRLHRFPSGVAHQVCRHPSFHGIPDYLTGEQILDAGEIQPAFRGRHVRDVGDPDMLRRLAASTIGIY